MTRPKLRRFCLAACMALLAAPSLAWSGVNVTQALDFGQWFIASNSAGASVVVGANGAYNHSGPITRLRTPQPGVYVITGLAPNAAVNGVVVSQAQDLSNGSGTALQMDQFDVIADPATDGAGSLNIRVGGRATFSGGHAPGRYDGRLQLDFDINM